VASSVNEFTKFQGLINNDHVEIITITANNADGTSTGTTPSGDIVKVRGETVAAGNNAFVKNGVVDGQAPNLSVIGVII